NGTTDLLWRDGNGTTAAWLMSNGARSSTPYYGSTAGWNVAAIGDFNADGRDDILWQQPNGTTAAWLMNNGTIRSSAFYASTAGFAVVGAADFGLGAADDLLWLRQSDGASGTWMFDHMTAQSWLVA